MEMSIDQRKDYIVLTAIDLIHEKGIHNVSTKEIARRLGISEGLVFKIYPRKNDILMAVLEHFERYDKDMYQTAIEKNEDPMEAIRFIMEKYLMYYENYPAITSVYQIIDTLKGDLEIECKSREIYRNRQGFIKNLIVTAQETGRMKNTTAPDVVADILLSVLDGMCTKWRLMDYNFSLSERVNKGIKLLLEALII